MCATNAQKALGAFYTDEKIARFLVGWAVRSSSERILDPCFGGAVFLETALELLSRLGNGESARVTGVELEAAAYDRASRLLAGAPRTLEPDLILGDFFSIAPRLERLFTAVVGNPPFVRYQKFSGEGRRMALSLARASGVELSRLSSSWAPFIIASVQCLKAGGRLAMVVPAEICHAAYARPVLGFLLRSFRSVTLLTFRERPFSHLSQDTMLLLADDRQWPNPRAAGGLDLKLLDVSSAEALALLDPIDPGGAASAEPLDCTGLLSGETRFVTQYMPLSTRHLYSEISTAKGVTRLGTLAGVGIGYVTGANSFFHLDRRLMEEFSIPSSCTLRAVTRSAHLRGLTYRGQDWGEDWGRGERSRLLYLPEDLADLPPGVRTYLARGESRGVAHTYKCRVRKPWYRVPHVFQPDAILTYMSGTSPRLVANEAGVVVPNTLHALRVSPDAPETRWLALSFQSSLSQLSAEIEGHSMGGGLLKMEPQEAERVLLCHPARAGEVADDVEALLRSDRLDEARGIVDRFLLIEHLGLSRRECHLLSDGTRQLRERRLKRGRGRKLESCAGG